MQLMTPYYAVDLYVKDCLPNSLEGSPEGIKYYNRSIKDLFIGKRAKSYISISLFLFPVQAEK